MQYWETSELSKDLSKHGVFIDLNLELLISEERIDQKQFIILNTGNKKRTLKEKGNQLFVFNNENIHETIVLYEPTNEYYYLQCSIPFNVSNCAKCKQEPFLCKQCRAYNENIFRKADKKEALKRLLEQEIYYMR